MGDELVHAFVVDHVDVGAGDLVADVVPAGVREAARDSLLVLVRFGDVVAVVVDHVDVRAGDLVAYVVPAAVRVLLGDLRLRLGRGVGRRGLAVMASGVSGGADVKLLFGSGGYFFVDANAP